MNADPNPRADHPSLDNLALFRPTPVGASTALPGRVRSSFRLSPGDTRPDIRLLASEPKAFEPVPGTSLPSSMTPGFSIDWKLVAAFRGKAAEALTQRLGQATSREAQQELGRAIITELLDAAADEAVTAGRSTWTRAEQVGLAQAIFDSLFRLGRLQPLVDDDRVENIIILGHDRVWLELVDGTLIPGPAVADSDEELIEFISFLASREGSARSFSEAHPSLDLRLADGSRLSATNWVTSTPSIVIRRHRLVDVTLDDLVRLGTLTPVMATFLSPDPPMGLAEGERSGSWWVLFGCAGRGRGWLPGVLSGFATGFSWSCRWPAVVQAGRVAGGPLALLNSRVQAGCQGQLVGRWSVMRRAL